MAYPPIQLVVFDWAGTTVDHGCFAPVAAFIESFARFGVFSALRERTTAQFPIQLILLRFDDLRPPIDSAGSK